MEYKFFTDDEANYISEIFKGTNTIKKNNFEKEFYNLHYDELIKGRRGEEWINDAEKEKGLTDNQFLITKVKALNHGIGCLNYFNGNDIDDRKDTLLDVIRNRYKYDENYIKLLSYILLSSSPKRIDNIEKFDLFIDDLIEILNDKDIKKYYIENYDYLKGKELKEKEDKERKIKIDSVIDSINKENKKYKLSEFRRDIFSDTIATLQKEGKINSLLNDEKIKIFKIWSDCIVKHENFYAIIGEIKKYCNNIGKDYTMALYSIYLKNQHHYYCRYSDYDTTEYYYERGSLMNVLYRRIEKKYNGEIDIEDDMAKIFNILDNNTDNNDGYFDITTAKEQKVSVFFCFDIDIIRKLNSYTLLLEEEIEKEIEKINPQKQNKEYVNFEDLIENKEKILTDIHKLVVGKNILDCTLIDFLQAIKNADFSSLEIKVKSKTKFLIYRLSLILDDKWYTQICKNMNFKKEQCSGANINNSDYFKKQIINLTTN
ncbi:MAG: hypothetical protein VB011_05380 [Bacteroidales bacterium]|nr:hypothetical protein [Bacteroidales bacterium]